MKFFITTLTVVVSLVSTSISKAEANIPTVKKAISWAFCGKSYKPCWLGNEAIQVASCETGKTFDIYATNGWYKGLFQMGEEERARWGVSKGWMSIGNNPWDQALSAYAMYKWTSTHEAGDRWHRWSCRPDGTVAY